MGLAARHAVALVGSFQICLAAGNVPWLRHLAGAFIRSVLDARATNREWNAWHGVSARLCLVPSELRVGRRHPTVRYSKNLVERRVNCPTYSMVYMYCAEYVFWRSSAFRSERYYSPVIPTRQLSENTVSMASDRPLYPANELCHRSVGNTIHRVVPMRGAHDQFNHIDRITAPTPPDRTTHALSTRAHKSTGILRRYRNLQRWPFAGDSRRHQLAPHEYQQGPRDAFHSSFIQRSGIFAREKTQDKITPSLPDLIARLHLCSSSAIPQPNTRKTQAQTLQRQALLRKRIEDMLEEDRAFAKSNPPSPTLVDTAVRATTWVTRVCRKRDLFNKDFSFTAPQKHPFEHSPSISPKSSPRSSISLESSTSMLEEPAKRQRIDSSNPRTFCSHDTSSSPTMQSGQHPAQDTLGYSTPHPGHPVDFTTPHPNTEEYGSVTDPDSYFDSNVQDDCFEPSQRRSSFPHAYVRHQIAEEFVHREWVKGDGYCDELRRSRLPVWSSSIVSSSHLVQVSSYSSSESTPASSRSSARTSADSTDLFLQHLRMSHEARKRMESDYRVFEDEVGRAYASSEPL